MVTRMSKPAFAHLFVLLCGLSVLCAQSAFKPATFHGLVVGKATISQATKQLGPPKTVFKDGDGTTWVYYENIGPVPGRVEMIGDTKSGVIESITISTEGLSLDSAKALFGRDFRTVRYNFDECLGNGDAAPLYEDPDGQLEYLVYDELGIALRYEPGTVTSIEYLGEPLGSKVSRCKPSGKGSKSGKGKR
jgi:hypothetical protein